MSLNFLKWSTSIISSENGRLAPLPLGEAAAELVVEGAAIVQPVRASVRATATWVSSSAAWRCRRTSAVASCCCSSSLALMMSATGRRRFRPNRPPARRRIAARPVLNSRTRELCWPTSWATLLAKSAQPFDRLLALAPIAGSVPATPLTASWQR